MFRVHRALIARHSEVFRHMFSFPQPPNVDKADIIEGCPVVELHDATNDIASLLRAIYDGPYVLVSLDRENAENMILRNWADNGVDDFNIVSGVLRLSHKYMIEPLRIKAIQHLQKAWPSTLEGWDAREELARFYNGDIGGRFPHPAVSVA